MEHDPTADYRGRICCLLCFTQLCVVAVFWIPLTLVIVSLARPGTLPVAVLSVASLLVLYILCCFTGLCCANRKRFHAADYLDSMSPYSTSQLSMVSQNMQGIPLTFTSRLGDEEWRDTAYRLHRFDRFFTWLETHHQSLSGQPRTRDQQREAGHSDSSHDRSSEEHDAHGRHEREGHEAERATLESLPDLVALQEVFSWRCGPFSRLALYPLYQFVSHHPNLGIGGIVLYLVCLVVSFVEGLFFGWIPGCTWDPDRRFILARAKELGYKWAVCSSMPSPCSLQRLDGGLILLSRVQPLSWGHEGFRSFSTMEGKLSQKGFVWMELDALGGREISSSTTNGHRTRVIDKEDSGSDKYKDGSTIMVVATHVQSGVLASGHGVRNEQFMQMSALLRRCTRAIVIGDLNTNYRSREEYKRMLKALECKDTWPPDNTPTDAARPMTHRWTHCVFDYVLTKDLRGDSWTVDTRLSDHLAVIAKVALSSRIEK